MPAKIRTLTPQYNAPLTYAIANNITTVNAAKSKLENNIELTQYETMVFLVNLSEQWSNQR